MNNLNLEEFGNRIIKLREKSGKAQEEICTELGVTQQTLSRYEKGQRQASLDFVFKASKFFDVSVDYLLGLTDIKSTNSSIKEICEFTGLTEESLQILKHYKNDYHKIITDLNGNEFNLTKKDIINIILSSDFFLDQIDITEDFYSDMINKHLKQIMIDKLYNVREPQYKVGKIFYYKKRKLSEEELEIVNKLENEIEELVENASYKEFILTKCICNFFDYIEFFAKETAERLNKKEEENANDNPQEE